MLPSCVCSAVCRSSPMEETDIAFFPTRPEIWLKVKYLPWMPIIQCNETPVNRFCILWLPHMYIKRFVPNGIYLFVYQTTYGVNMPCHHCSRRLVVYPHTGVLKS